MDAARYCYGGLDVHQETVMAYILNGPLDQKPKSHIRTFGTTTKQLLELQDWLAGISCTEIVMESVRK
ncbi:hypothetical protein [Paenibacillus aceris]|uniref:IS110 family transposase n=1 Tax=Paenibacillus aceris TaxID=869555 RepID=A0ABS4I9Y6_9BACL|nr:hypothetical protein [Paenibacillus aceris]MBP1967752.1 hypothetical protein [Paenibacillus aceris]NHW38182.1 hypothetical protein [Paenibacillus aceris]